MSVWCAGFERARDGFEIDFGLARAGDAVEQGDGEIVGIDGASQAFDGTRLIGGEACRLRMRGLRARKDALGDRDFDEHAGSGEAIDHARRAAGEIGKIRFRADKAVGCDFEDAGARLASFSAAGAAPSTMQTPKRCLGGSKAASALIIMRATMPSGRQRVACDPFGETHRNFGQARCVNAARQGLQLFRIDGLTFAARPVPNDADARLRPKRHEHERAGRGIHAIRHEIVVGLVERHGHEHGHAAGPASPAPLSRI